MFLYKNLFQYLLFFQSQSCLLESTAAIFRQSAGYVFFVKFPEKLLSYFKLMDLYEPLELIKASNGDAGWSLGTIKWF